MSLFFSLPTLSLYIIFSRHREYYPSLGLSSLVNIESFINEEGLLTSVVKVIHVKIAGE